MTTPTFSPDPLAGVTHTAPAEGLRMDKYHFLWVLQRMRDDAGRFRPKGEWALIPLGIFLGMMQALLTSDFKDAFGIEKEVWKASAINIIQGSALATVVLFVWWVIDRCTRRNRGPEQILEEVIVEMAKDRERLSKPHEG